MSKYRDNYLGDFLTEGEMLERALAVAEDESLYLGVMDTWDNKDEIWEALDEEVQEKILKKSIEIVKDRDFTKVGDE